MAGLDPAIHAFLLLKETKNVDARHKAGHDGMPFSGNAQNQSKRSSNQHARSTGPSPTMSGCRASDTAGDIRITSACAAKIAAAR
jgi:hypothetical protein